jgi:hypothetical protein
MYICVYMHIYMYMYIYVYIYIGTARNLEFFSVETIRRNFKAIYILDISASLLSIAQRRVDAMGLGDIVKVIEHDFTATTVFALLPPAGTVDMVTMSYSFSMIPNQQVCICLSHKITHIYTYIYLHINIYAYLLAYKYICI